MVVPFGEADYYRARPSIAIRGQAGDAERRARSRRLLRPQPAAAAAQAALGRAPARDRPRVRIARQHAVALRRAGLHGDGRRPASKSTADGWLNRYLQARRDEATLHDPFRAVSLTQQLPRMLQGTAPALAISQIAQFGIRAGSAATSRRVVRGRVRARRADRVLNGTGREAFDAIKHAARRRPGEVPARAAAPSIRVAASGRR